MPSPINKPTRLESLDILRGADLFALVVLEVLIYPLHKAIDTPWFENVMWVFTHKEWEGFSPWDLVMPLFMFMSGITIPFALSRFRNGGRRQAIGRIARRALLLWVFGMMCQGNILALNPERIYLFSNTLQAIAVGYTAAALLYLFTPRTVQIAVAIGLLALYQIGMEWLSIDGFGGGSYAPENNFAEGIDRYVLGRFRDGAEMTVDGVRFAPWYNYTWIWSSLNFIVTAMSGLLAGYVLRAKNLTPPAKARQLLVIGIVMVAAGWMLHPIIPVIKRIWTGSMTLVSGGYCFLLMSLFYYVIDCRHRGKRTLGWLKIYGQNSLLAYMLALCVSFSSIGNSLLFGLEQYIGTWYPVLIALINVAINYWILWMMHRNGIFLKA